MLSSEAQRPSLICGNAPVKIWNAKKFANKVRVILVNQFVFNTKYDI
jgi:hypothetical protein